MSSIRRLLPAAAILVLIAVAFRFGLPAVDALFKEKVASAIAAGRAKIEGQFGLSISFESFSPSILHSIAFKDMVLRDHSGRAFLEAKTVRVYYDIFAILKGQSYNALKTIDLQNATANVELPRDTALLQLLATYVFPPPGTPMPRFRIVGRSLALHINEETLGALAISARDFNYSSVGATTEISLSGSYVVSPRGGSVKNIEGPLDVSGSLASDVSMARMQIAVAGRSSDFDFSTQRFELVYSGGVAELRKVRDMAPLDASVSFDTRDMSLTASLRVDGFVPERAVRLHGALAAVSPWLKAPYSGSVSFNLPSGDLSHARYAVNLDTTLPESLLPGSYRVAISASGDLQSAQVAYLRLGDRYGSIEYRGAFDFKDLAPDGNVTVALSLERGTLPLSTTVRLYGHGGVYTAFAERVDAGTVEFRDLSITAAYKTGSLEFQASVRPPEGETGAPLPAVQRFSGEGGAEPGGFPLISIEGSASLAAAPTIDLSASLENVDLRPLQPLLSLTTGSPEAGAFLGDLKLGGELFVTSDFSRLSWSVSDLAVVSRSIPDAYALLSLSGNMQSIEVRRLLVSAAGYTVEGTGSVDFAQAGRLGFEASLALQNIPYQLRGAVVGRGIFITGDYGLSVSAHSERGETFFSASAKNFPVPSAGGVALATLDTDGRFASAADWSLAVNRLDLAPADEKTSALPRLSLSGVLGPTSGRFPTLRVEDRYSRLEGSIALQYTLVGDPSATITASLSALPRFTDAGPSSGVTGETGGTVGSAYSPGHAGLAASGASSLRSSSGTDSELERYSLDLSYAAGRFDGSLDFTASPVARLGLENLGGSVDGRLSMHGTLADPLIDVDARLREGTLDGEPLSLSLTGGYADRSIKLRSITARYLGHQIRSGSATLSLDDSSLTVVLDYLGTIGGKQLTMAVEAMGTRVQETGAETSQSPAGGGASDSTLSAVLADLPKLFRNYRLSGAIRGLSVGGAKVSRWPFSLTVASEGIHFAGGETGELQATLQSGGAFAVTATAPFPASFVASGTISGASLDARLDGVDIDLAALSPLFSFAPVSFESGRIRGALTFKGPLVDPEVAGSLGLESAVLSAPNWLSAKLGPFSAPLTAEGKSLALSASDIPAGKARLFLNATADIDHWLPVNFKASIRTGEASPLDVNFGVKGILVKGEALFDLSAELRGDVLALSGALTLQRASVVIGPEVFAGGEGSGGAFPYPILAQAQLRFGRGVEVFFPSKDLPVVSGYADPSSVLSLHYDQSVEDLSVKGTLALRGGEVFYIQRSFFLRSATILFNETLDHFDPLVTMLAELRDRNDQGSVLITLRTDRTPISNFKPTLSSDPPMSESDIASLLGTGLFDVSSDQTIDFRKAVISSSEFLPPLNVAKVFEQRVRDGLGLDVFSISTQFLQRWLIDVSNPTQTATTDPLGRYLNQTALYVGKYIGDSVFIHGEARFQEDPLVSGQPLRIDSELGIEFDTPFGLVQWSIAPTRPDSLYISDQSLSLTWRLSY